MLSGMRPVDVAVRDRKGMPSLTIALSGEALGREEALGDTPLSVVLGLTLSGRWSTSITQP